jgi:hypothetical protein
VTVPFLISPLLADAGVVHGFFTREGGVSEGLYGSLNGGPGSNDEPSHVIENRRRAALALGLAVDRLYTPFQVHSARAVTAPWTRERPQGDAVVATRPGVGCCILTADCAPVLLADPMARVVAAVHAGWKGAVGGVLEDTLALMKRCGANPDRVIAAVGPVIGPQSYEVGDDFEATLLVRDPRSSPRFAPGDAIDKRRFDLPGYVLDRLERAGVRQAEWIGRDTLAEPEVFFSHRRSVLAGEPETGRLMSVIALA